MTNSLFNAGNNFTSTYCAIALIDTGPRIMDQHRNWITTKFVLDLYCIQCTILVSFPSFGFKIVHACHHRQIRFSLPLYQYKIQSDNLKHNIYGPWCKAERRRWSIAVHYKNIYHSNLQGQETGIWPNQFLSALVLLKLRTH